MAERQMKGRAKSSKSFHWRDKETAESLPHFERREVEWHCEILYLHGKRGKKNQKNPPERLINGLQPYSLHCSW